ncbi:type II secretion system F family protein [Patescibacteria group bacterium]|nr:type II secretion system F family protein [Patescibacteria group bacterium]
MEYINNQNDKISETRVSVDNLRKDGELTKVSPQMTSFKLYTKKPTSKTAKKEDKEITPIHKKGFILGRVSLTDKMLFMDNMSTMLRAGLALAPALRTLKQEIKNKYFRDILDYLERHVENGQPLSKGMKYYPKIFPEMIIATVEVGESTGMLADSFGNLADILKRQKELQGKVISAVMYPSIVMLALIAVSIFLALVIFPQLVGLFQSANVELPFVLRAVQAINGFIRNYTWHTLGGLVIFGVAMRFIFKFPKPKFFLHSMMLKIPFIGKIIRELSLTRWAGNLQALLGAGLAIVNSMKISAQTLGNIRFKNAVLEMSDELEKGTSLEKAMLKRPDLFPSLSTQLCQVGETTGELEEILGKISKFYEDRVNNILSNLSTILEPILLVVVGVVVGFIAVSVIGPMYELTLSFAE